MRFLLVEDIYPTVVYTRSASLLEHPTAYVSSSISPVHPTAVYTRSILLLVYPMAVYARFISLLENPIAVHPRFISLLADPTILYPIMAQSSLFPMVVRPRFILLVYPTAVHIRIKSLQAYKMAVYTNDVTASIPNGCLLAYPTTPYPRQ